MELFQTLDRLTNNIFGIVQTFHKNIAPPQKIHSKFAPDTKYGF